MLKNKVYLYITEFFSGMAIMAVELGASRLLAPYFSSSQIVWTIIIATIMIAMALGNVYGGRSADRRPDPDVLYRRLLIAAVWIAAIPVLGKYVILLISGILILTIDTNLLIIAGFAACMVIFVFPCFLLGTVTPSLVKYTVDSLEESGTTVGTLSAFNTVGSIIGTFLPTFVTIPAFGTAVTFLLFSAIVLVIGLIYFFHCRRKLITCIICIVLFVLCAIFGNASNFAFWEEDLTYEGESVYNYLQVKETPRQVILSTNVLFGVQSVLEKEDSLTGMYYDYAMAAPVMAYAATRSDEAEPDSDRLKVLILGMGTGTFFHQCETYFGPDRLDMTGVEIDEKITALARRYFDLPDSARVTTYDGRAYLNVDKNKYDVIMVDAYQDITIPFQMSSAEFFMLVKDHLTDRGVMVVNMNMKTGTAGGINDYLQDTVASVFPHVCTADVSGNTNRELFASTRPFDREAFLASSSSLCKDWSFNTFMRTMSADLKPYTGRDRILTDDKAPVELLSMKAIDEIIQEELSYYKDLYRREGLQGIMEDLGVQ